MFLQEFDTNKSKFEKIQNYLRENHKCEIATDKLSYVVASRLLESTREKLNKITNKNSKEFAKLQMIYEGLELWKQSPSQFFDHIEESIDEESVDEAKVIISAQDLSIELQKIIEKLSELQVQNLIPIIDKMKTDLGIDTAERFNEKVDSAFSQLIDTAKVAKDSLNDAILMASGKATMSDTMPTDGMDKGRDMNLGGDELDKMGPEMDSFDTGERKLKGESINYGDALLELKKHTANGKVNKKTLESLLSRVKK